MQLRALQIGTVREAKILVPRKTGHLGRSIVPGRISATHATVEARTPYAAAVELGSGLHGKRHAKYPIVPKKAKVLAWGGARRLSGTLRTGSRATNFATRVMHPGVKARPYLIPGARKAIGNVRDVIVKLWNAAA